MFQARSVVFVIFSLLTFEGPAHAGAVDSDARGTSTDVRAEDGPADDRFDDDGRVCADYHDVRIQTVERLGRPEKFIDFIGGERAFPAFSVRGARDLHGVHLRLRERSVAIHWISPGTAGSFVHLNGVTADDVTYEDGAVWLRDRNPDGSWTRRRLRRLVMTLEPVGQNMAQMLVGGTVALTALFAHPGDPYQWLAVAGAGALTTGAACATWLSGGWRAEVDVGPAESEPGH